MSNLNQINEIIDISNECDKNLDNLECRINGLLVNSKDYFSYEKNGKNYYAVVNGLKLDIPIYNQGQLISTLNEIKTLLSVDSELNLSGDLHMRYIEKDISILGKISNLIKNGELGNIVIESGSKREDKNYIEEIFEFVMAIKGITKENWNIHGEICKSDRESCIAELGSSRVDYLNNQHNTLLAKE
ncbi:MAG: hypothetical protein NWP80_01690 [Candidatus Gracilibacteria bacterium]|nr:hypothetical protein [Candidatus Gracilibacteria bacterium]